MALLPEQERQAAINSLTDKEAEHLLYDWEFWARPKQLPPDWDWFCWLLLTGRGFGKTRTGAEWVINRVKNGYRRVALIGQTKADVRDTMVEIGDSSLLQISPPWFMPDYQPSKRRIVWPNGAVAIIYSGDEPNQLRGPQHDSAWVDELAKFKYPQETWDNMEMGLRLGDKPQVVVTTTPRPIPIVKNLANDEATHITRGSSYENIHNLAAAFIQRVLKRYEGTYLGRQEIHAEILDDAPGALWKRETIEASRVVQHEPLGRIVVGIDPPGGVAECGIIVAGKVRTKGEIHGYVLDDRSLQASPKAWAKEAITAFNRNAADRIVAEVNFGGDMVEATLLAVDKTVPYKAVRASRGKAIRAEPIAALYERGLVHHVGAFSQLEDEMCTWVPGEGMPSPNRLDALVWALTELMFEDKEYPKPGVSQYA